MPAQNAPHPAFRQYTTDDGLASSEIYHILQSRDGFIWISSDNGVSRFDGYEFRNYGLKDGLRENVIFAMQLDTLGRIWMQAMSGNLYYMDGQTIRPYRHNDVLQNFKNRPDFGKGFIVEGAGETVHIATLKYGVITISRDGTAMTYPQEEPAYKQVFEKNGKAIYAQFQQAEPATLPAGPEKPLRQNRSSPVYFYSGGEVWPFPDFPYFKEENQAIEAFYLGEGKFFFQMSNSLWLIENGKARWQKNYPSPCHIGHACLMKNGQLFVGLLERHGLRVYNSIDAFRKDEGAVWLPGKSVSCFLEDKEGGFWFGTNQNGVFYAPADAFMVYDQETGLSNEKVTALAIKNEQELYVGLQNGEVWHLGQGAEIWARLPELPAAGFIRDLHIGQQNERLWAGKGYLFYLQKNEWIKARSPSLPGSSFIPANRITESLDSKRLWACYVSGFMSIELPQMLAGNFHKGGGQRTYVVREDYAGRNWVGQPKGLFEWKDGALHERQSLHPAFSLRVEDIAMMPDSTLVVATKGGGLVFWKEGKFEQITAEQGLAADMLECLHADEKGVVWAGTLNGLNRISGRWGKRQVEQITVFHGLPSNEINCIRTFGENVWVATSKGLVHFSNKKKSLASPKPVLASVLANNRPLGLGRPLILGWKENNLAIGFFAVNYKMNGKIPYRYRMDGGDWAQTLNRSLNFPALPPGERFFEVQAQNEDGAWSESASLRLIINPPWWASWWARTAAILAALSLGFALYQYRTGQLKRENQVQRQIAELERSALQAQMNPHFIFNCLNSIQKYILQNEKEAAILYLGRFAGLVRSMLNASVAGKILLAEEVKLLNHYLELEKLRFKNRFDYEIQTAEGLDAFEVQIPPLLVQPYVENAVLHGISGKASGGKVAVFFEKKENYLEVSIQDNGPGWKSESGDAKSLKGHKSFGMSITRNRLELLSDSRENEAVRSHALLDENGQVCGTQVTIRIGLREQGLTNKI